MFRSDATEYDEAPEPQPPSSETETVSAQQWHFDDDTFRLWDELSNIKHSRIDEGLTHCLQTICNWIGAQNAFWIGAVRISDGNKASTDLLNGWRVGGIQILNSQYTSTESVQKGIKNLDTGEPGITTRVLAESAGHFRAYSLGTGIVDIEAFKQTPHYDYFYRKPNIVDRIWVVFPVNVDAESYFVFDRISKTPSHFTSDEIRLTAKALRGIKWFHRLLLLSRGLGIGNTPLTPAERRVLPHLLAGSSEKVIADKLKLTQGTVHQYVTSMYRKLGVRGRTQFMALWLQGRH